MIKKERLKLNLSRLGYEEGEDGRYYKGSDSIKVSAKGIDLEIDEPSEAVEVLTMLSALLAREKEEQERSSKYRYRHELLSSIKLDAYLAKYGERIGFVDPALFPENANLKPMEFTEEEFNSIIGEDYRDQFIKEELELDYVHDTHEIEIHD